MTIRDQYPSITSSVRDPRKLSPSDRYTLYRNVRLTRTEERLIAELNALSNSIASANQHPQSADIALRIRLIGVRFKRRRSEETFP